jgi:hypothetical protein
MAAPKTERELLEEMNERLRDMRDYWLFNEKRKTSKLTY